MVIEDYVSFETAKLLKEKGFDEATIGYYPIVGKAKETFHKGAAYRWNYFSDRGIAAPTLQMAIKWLKEEHNLGVIPCWSQVSGEFGCHIYDLTKKGSQEYHSIRGSFDGFEEPAELGIKYCLENLI